MKKRCGFLLLFLSIALVLFGTGFKLEESGAVIVMYSDGVSVTYKDKKAVPTDTLVAEEIFVRKINAPFEKKIAAVTENIRLGMDFKSALLYTFPFLKKSVEEFVSKSYVPPRDAEIFFRPDERILFAITEEKMGYRINEVRLYRDIYYELLKSSKVSVKGKKIYIRPQITSAALRADTYLRARYSTDFSSSVSQRKHNIGLALSKINGTVLERGGEFSFNSVVGKRSKENGFMKAKIIVGGKYEEGYGGGVCQASTTLYNAALLSGLTITEARPHTLKVAYELPSFDAMVNSGASDLRFVNETTGNIFIRAYASCGRAIVEIYGPILKYAIKRRSVVLEEGETPGYEEICDTEGKYFTEETESGTKKIISYPHASLKSEGYLDYYSGENFVRSVCIRRDKYSECMGIIAVAP